MQLEPVMSSLQGRTPLVFAMYGDRSGLVSLLLSCGADVAARTNEVGRPGPQICLFESLFQSSLESLIQILYLCYHRVVVDVYKSYELVPAAC